MLSKAGFKPYLTKQKSCIHDFIDSSGSRVLNPALLSKKAQPLRTVLLVL